MSNATTLPVQRQERLEERAAEPHAPPPTAPQWLLNRRARPAEVADSPASPPKRKQAGDTEATATVPSSEGERCHGRNLWKNESSLGVAISLALHAVIMFMLAWVMMEARPTDTSISLQAGTGTADEGLDSELVIDSVLTTPIEQGADSAPLEFAMFDPSEFATDDTNVEPGDVLTGMMDGVASSDGLGTTGSGLGEGLASTAVRGVPTHAVTKGSFSAWTEPRDPVPGKRYVIVIQVRVPRGMTEYRAVDLKGMVIGTDRYRQVIRFLTTDKVPVVDGAVELRVIVPGAERLVRDTIRLESRLLKEKQTLEIEF